jgi:hypothetical protein
MARQSKVTRTRQALEVIMGAAFRFVGRALSSLAVWTMPIVVVGITVSALTGQLNFHRGSGLAPDPEQAVIDGERPYMLVRLYYSDDYIKIVKKAHEQGNDILADFKALESAWNASAPSTSFALELVTEADPEPSTGTAIAPVLRVPVAINGTNFTELRPYLTDLRTVIVEGDGSGCGRLRHSGYQAQPAESAENLSSSSRHNNGGFFHVGPGEVAPHSAIQF